MKHTCDKIYKQNISQNINFSLRFRFELGVFLFSLLLAQNMKYSSDDRSHLVDCVQQKF